MKVKTVLFVFAMWFLMVSTGLCGAISVSPAALSLKGTPGRSHTHVFEIANSADAPYTIDIDVADVLVRQGKRTFVSPDRVPDSLAAMVTIPGNRHIVLQPGERFKVPVTFVAPDETRNRAVVVFFHALREKPVPNQPKIRLNLGTVVDFTVTNEVNLRIMALGVEPQTMSSNVAITEDLANVGPEPTIAKGVVAILSEAGNLVGKTEFQQKRLLPSEHNQTRAEYPGTLKPGKYRAVCTLAFADSTLTRVVELNVQ
jgi:hypothetical protein